MRKGVQTFEVFVYLFYMPNTVFICLVTHLFTSFFINQAIAHPVTERSIINPLAVIKHDSVYE